jgi:hypothetical protein
MPQNMFTLSRKVIVCKPLEDGGVGWSEPGPTEPGPGPGPGLAPGAGAGAGA